MGIKNLAWMLVLVIGVASSEAQSVAQRGTARNFDLGKLPLSFEANRDSLPLRSSSSLADRAIAHIS